MVFQNILLQVLTVQKNKVIYYANVPASFAYYTLKRESSTRKNKKKDPMGGTQAWFGQWYKTHLFTDYRQAFSTQFIRHSDTSLLATFQNKTSLIMQCWGTTAIGTNTLKELQDELNLFMFREKKKKKKLLKGHLPFLGYRHLQ